MFYIKEHYDNQIYFIPFDKINYVVYNKNKFCYYFSVIGLDTLIKADQEILDEYLKWRKIESYGNYKIRTEDREGRSLGLVDFKDIHRLTADSYYKDRVQITTKYDQFSKKFISRKEAKLIGRYHLNINDIDNLHIKEMEEFFDRREMIRRDDTLACEERWKRMNESDTESQEENNC